MAYTQKVIFRTFENATNPMAGREIRRLKLNPVSLYYVLYMIWLQGNIKYCAFSEGMENPYHKTHIIPLLETIFSMSSYLWHLQSCWNL